jgi:ribonuclease HI
MSDIIIFTDGGSRGNPGPAACGVFIKNEKEEVLAKIGKYLGNTTNNVAEYSAIIEGFKWVVENKDKIQMQKIYFYMDSLLAYSQLVGLYKVKNEKIREMVFDIRKFEAQIHAPIIYSHIPREKNTLADELVNIALDNQVKSN